MTDRSIDRIYDSLERIEAKIEKIICRASENEKQVAVINERCIARENSEVQSNDSFFKIIGLIVAVLALLANYGIFFTKGM